VEDWLVQSQRAAALQKAAATAAAASVATPAVAAPPAAPAPTAPAAANAPRRKLSYKEQRELDELPGRIEALETEQKTLADLMAGSDLYTRTPERIAEVHARHAQIEEELLELLERWESLGNR
jgi:ATP-binding cassette subfamily F protein uup